MRTVLRLTPRAPFDFKFVKKKYLGGRIPSDSQIQDIYKEWGEWRFLAYWFDLWQGFDGEL